jgi:sulfoxide reductase catalytic subunit YedY
MSLQESGEYGNHSRPPPIPLRFASPARRDQLGFTMVKYIRAIEFVASYAHIGKGQGGWWEDYQYFSQQPGI